VSFPRARVIAGVGAWLLVVLVFESWAQTQSRFDVWTTESGLPQNSVLDILQTRDGYLWIATEGGLARFDGVRFTVFDTGVAGIGSHRITSLYEDRHGVLWAATRDGMLIRRANGQFTTFDQDDGLPLAAGVRIEEDTNGVLWITWRGGLISTFDGNRFLTFSPARFAGKVTAPSAATLVDAWWGEDPGGLHVLVRGRIVSVPVRSVLPAHVAIAGVMPDRDGAVWITGADGSLVKASGTEVRRIAHPGLSRRPYRAFERAVGTETWSWAAGTDDPVRIRNGRVTPVPLPGRQPYYVVYGDREGSIWIGTLAGGLLRLRDPMITMYAKVADGEPQPSIYSILEDRAASIWIGNGGLHQLRDGRLVPFFARGETRRRSVSSLFEDARRRLWIGSLDGVRVLENGRLQRIADPSGFLDGSVSAITQDRTGAFWFATDLGLVRRSGDTLTRYTVADGLSHNRVTALFEDRSGTLWIGTFLGVTRLGPDGFTALRERDGFIGTQVRAFHEDSDGVLWIGTYDGGLYRLFNGRLTRYTRAEGLHDNGVFQIFEDSDGFFWMGSNRGIYRVSRQELNDLADGRRRSVTSVAFGVRDGLASLEVNGGLQPAGQKGADGRLWFPTLAGVAVIDPVAMRRSGPPPSVLIEEVFLAGEAAPLTDTLTIPAGVRSFDIRYTAPSFIKPEQVRFRYKLVGLDEEWIDAGDRRVASFYRIPPGSYRFVATAAGYDGAWGAAGQTLAIVVLRPFWQTPWFGGLTVASLGALGYSGHLARRRRRHRRQQEKEAFTRRLIDAQERERRRLAHELHDTLGQPVALITRSARTARERAGDSAAIADALTEIELFAAQIGMDVKEIARDLRPHHLDTIGLSKTIAAMARSIHRTGDLELTTAIDPIDEAIPEHLQIHAFRIVQECLNNVVKHSQATRAHVAITIDRNAVRIVVEDNGVGLPGESDDTRQLTSTGLGIMGMRERAEMLGGRLELRPGTRGGTVVVVTVPIAERSHG
jgi:signal transduction histidine kinase/ligand-binding sensor domain-containing protein